MHLMQISHPVQYQARRLIGKHKSLSMADLAGLTSFTASEKRGGTPPFLVSISPFAGITIKEIHRRYWLFLVVYCSRVSLLRSI